MTDRTVTSEEKPAPVVEITNDELMRLAFLWAEQDRLGFAEANHDGTPERAQAELMAQRLHDYRMKRWGQTKLEAVLAKATLVDVRELQRRGIL